MYIYFQYVTENKNLSKRLYFKEKVRCDIEA